MKDFNAWFDGQRAPTPPVIGYEEGDVCNRNGCEGTMEYRQVENCSCHISPPCNACVDNPWVCSECGCTSDEE